MDAQARRRQRHPAADPRTLAADERRQGLHPGCAHCGRRRRDVALVTIKLTRPCGACRAALEHWWLHDRRPPSPTASCTRRADLGQVTVDLCLRCEASMLWPQLWRAAAWRNRARTEQALWDAASPDEQDDLRASAELDDEQPRWLDGQGRPWE